MNPGNGQKTFIDYRKSLRKVSQGQPGSQPTTPQKPPTSNPIQVPAPYEVSIPRGGPNVQRSPSGNGQQKPLALNSPPPPQYAYGPPSAASSIYTTSPRRATSGSEASFTNDVLLAPQDSPAKQPTLVVPQSETPTKQPLSQQASLRVQTPVAPVDTERAVGPRTALVVTTASPPENLQTYLSTIVDVHGAERVVLLGPSNDVLKKGKMDCYTVAGKQSKNVSVQTVCKGEEGLIESLASQELGGLAGVLIYTAAGTASTTESDILRDQELNMGDALKSSVVDVFDIARSTMPLLSRQRAAENGEPRRQRQASSFFVIHPAARGQQSVSFESKTQASLLQSIQASPSASGVHIGYAADFLTPRPPPPQLQMPPPVDQADKMGSRQSNVAGNTFATNGHHGQSNGYGNGTAYADDDALAGSAGESPTKLWSFWAAQNE